jgi:predicted TPR repeat methyltransferase
MDSSDTKTDMEEAVATRTELSFDEALSLGVQMLRAGALDDATRLYRVLSDMAPNDPNVLHFSGVLAHQQGRSDEAIALIQRSLELQSDQADWYSNLGIVYKATQQFDKAIAAYERAIALNPAHVNAYNNLGVLFRATGKPVDAEAAYRKALEIDPQFIDAYHNLGVLLASVNRTREAVICYCKVTTLSPRHPETRRMLGLAYCVLGEREKAIELYEEWLKDDPGNPVVTHLLAGCTGRDVPARTSDACVQIIFDNFAESFESKLSHLHYRAPALVHMMLEGSGRPPAKDLDVLDAGCGTGLCGPLVAPYARHLTGVDLSAGMLEQAKSKGIYEDLVQGELSQFLQEHPRAFDLILSADTLVYFGVLEEVVAAARSALRPGGLFVFTLEELVVDDGGVEVRLEPHGRYAHAQPYVERVLHASGFSTDIVHAELRMESGSPVPGLVIRATAPEGDAHA